MAAANPRTRGSERSDAVSDCKNYQGAINTSGYGWVSFRGKQMAASRKAWILERGEIESGLHVLHRCNNPRCINIDHLYLGNHSRNMRDRAIAGNQNNGKLNQEQVAEIRRSYNSKEATQSELSRKYKLSTGYVSDLVKGKHWK